MHTTSPSPPAWQLAAELNLPAADALLAGLQRHMAEREPILLDGSAVERISTACVQVLAAAAIAAQATGLAFETIAPSAVMRRAIADLGLAHVLGGAPA